jgi:glycosyltransferase involved in cell wall biosynthesis
MSPGRRLSKRLRFASLGASGGASGGSLVGSRLGGTLDGILRSSSASTAALGSASLSWPFGSKGAGRSLGIGFVAVLYMQRALASFARPHGQAGRCALPLGPMADVLFVSKAVAPPWNDSGKNLVRDLARELSRHRPTVMVGRDGCAELPHAAFAKVYDGSVGFAPALRDQARVFAYLLSSRGHSLWHFFFAPNPRSCLAGRLATRIRRKPSLHTIASAPRDAREIVPLLFAELNIVLSRHTERRLLEAGLAADRVRRIAPAIQPLEPRTCEQRAALRRELALPSDLPIVLYPGDLEFGEGAGLMLELSRASRRELCVVMACRAKTPRAHQAAEQLQARARALGLAERMRFIGETRRIHDYLACADVVALPSTDLYAKMDYPLVLLEAMSLERSVLVARGSAAAELAEQGGALALAAEVDALTDGVERLLDDDAARAQLGALARRTVCERYLPTNMARAYECAYDELLAR